MHKLVVGLEHLMTGLQLMPTVNRYGGAFQFQWESPSTFAVLHDESFDAYWPIKQVFMQSTEVDTNGVPPCKTSQGEVEYIAQVIAPKLNAADEHSYRMRGHTASSAIREYWPKFTPAIVSGMRAKFGKDADMWLSELKWVGDHWYFVKDDVYHGVEPDGYIHT